ncbi:MAG: hypothetical protein U0133_21885 [Gemmatimonadales bacterium]
MTAPGRPAAKKPAELVALAKLGKDATALLAPDIAHRAFVAKLVEKELWMDAVGYLAHALPKREGVWWAWVTAKRAAGPEPEPKIKESLEATEKWIAQPTDENRRVAFAKAEKADLGTAAGCSGAAAFFAGDSLAPPNLQAVPPGEWDTAKAIAGAVLIAVTATEPEKLKEKFQAAIQQGLDVITKIKLWPES